MQPTPPAGQPPGGRPPLGSRYRLGELLGHGGMGDVYRAWDHAGNPYAAKILRPELARDPGVVGRFVQERAILLGLRGPHLVRVHDLVVEGDTLALVMDLIEGSDLRRELARVGSFAPADAAAIGAGVASGLATAHAAGVVHLDVKPENVLLDPVVGPEAVWLTDFGVARLARSPDVGARYGTPHYVAPEVLAGEPVGPPADLYALGVLLYELGCGHPPFPGHTGLGVPTGFAPPRPAGMPEPMWELVSRLLAERPERRPASAAGVWAVLVDIAGWLGGRGAPPLPPPPPAPPAAAPTEPVAAATRILPVVPAAVPVAVPTPPPEQRPRLGRGPLAAMAALALAAAIGTGAWALYGGKGEGAAQAAPEGAASVEATPVPIVEPVPSAAPDVTLEPAPVAVPAACDARVEGSPDYPGQLGTALAGRYVENVVRVQQRLRERGYDVCVDGDYGPRTAAAVSAFQKDQGLPGGGTVGPITWARLFGRPDPAPQPVATPVAPPVSTGPTPVVPSATPAPALTPAPAGTPAPVTPAIAPSG